MQLFILLLILVVPYAAISLTQLAIPPIRLAPTVRARVALSLFFAFTGIGHFVKPAAIASLLPAATPYRMEIVYVTGVLELLAAIGIWLARWRQLTGLLLIVMLISFLPANVYGAMQRVDFGGHELGPAYLLARIPFQLLLIAWTYIATEQSWFTHGRGDDSDSPHRPALS